MSSFKDLKKNRMSNLDFLTKQIEKLAEKPSYEWNVGNRSWSDS